MDSKVASMRQQPPLTMGSHRDQTLAPILIVDLPSDRSVRLLCQCGTIVGQRINKTNLKANIVFMWVNHLLMYAA